MRPLQKRISVVEFAERPETNRIEELIEGEVVLTPLPTIDHQRIVGRIFVALNDWARRTHAGEAFVAPVGVHLEWDTVLEPDVLFVATERARIVLPDGVHGAPDLAVEVLSPSTAARDRRVKMKLYERKAVTEYWIVDPAARRIERYVQSESGFELARQFSDGDQLESENLRGFSLSVSDVFGR